MAKRKKVLVTGAGGYMGCGIVKQLLDWNYEVIATDIIGENIDKRAKIICADIFSEKDPYNKFLQPEIILHLAWRDGFKHNSLSHINDLSDHFKFIVKMTESGVNHISVMGSMHEIGYFEGMVNDDTPTEPLNLYGVAKDALRKSLTLYFKDKDIIFQWLRGYYIVGNALNGNSIFTKLEQAEIDGKAEFPFTTGKNKYDFIDYDEFCDQIAATIIQEKVTGIINCCSGKPLSLSDRVQQFINDNNFNIKLKYGAFPDREYDSPGIWGDNGKISRILKERNKGNN